MTTDDYLRDCADVPPLPSGWKWYVSVQEKDENRSKTDVPRIIRYTCILIEIADRDDEIQGYSLVKLKTDYVTAYPDMLSAEFAQGCRRAYHTLYRAEKVDFGTVFNTLGS